MRYNTRSNNDIEQVYEIMVHIAHASSEGSGALVQTYSLTSAFAVRIHTVWTFIKYQANMVASSAYQIK